MSTTFDYTSILSEVEKEITKLGTLRLIYDMNGSDVIENLLKRLDDLANRSHYLILKLDMDVKDMATCQQQITTLVSKLRDLMVSTRDFTIELREGKLKNDK